MSINLKRTARVRWRQGIGFWCASVILFLCAFPLPLTWLTLIGVAAFMCSMLGAVSFATSIRAQTLIDERTRTPNPTNTDG